MAQTLCHIAIILVLAASNLLADQSIRSDYLFDIDGELLTPSEIHAIMAQQKAIALDQSRRAQLTIAEAAYSSTQTNYDVISYDIFIRVDDTTKTLHGAVVFDARAVENSVSQIEFDLTGNMAIDSIVSLAGLLAYTRSADVVTVTLDQSYDTGDPFEFTVHYHGQPVSSGLQAFSFGSVGGAPAISSLSEPYLARSWWPCKDRMDDKADSFKIAIEVDTSLYVASNGTLDSVVGASVNSHLYHYTSHYPMASYLFSLAIHPYSVWTDEYVYNGDLDTMPLVHAVYPGRYEYSLTKYDITPQVLQVLSDNFGEYPFTTEKYGHANFQWGGGMEHQTMTSMTGSDFGFSEPVVVHEASHQWWGDMITCKSWSDIWLNEGWASYAEALYYGALGGWPAYHSYMSTMAYYGDGTIYVHDTMNIGAIFSRNLSYNKAAWVVHMLRGVLGDSLFFAGIEAYYNSQYKFGAIDTEEFRDVWEMATCFELDNFFQEWIYGQFYPAYRYEFTTRCVDVDDCEILLWVEQVQTTTPTIFHMPVDFFLDFVEGPGDTVTLPIEARSQLFRIPTTGNARNIELDPSDWILKSADKSVWTLHILSEIGDLSDGVWYLPYRDTIEYYAVYNSGNTSAAVVSGAIPDGYTIDGDGVITGVTEDSGLFTFTVQFHDLGTGYSDHKEFSLYVNPSEELVPGDADYVDGIVDIGDLTYLIAYLYMSGDPPQVRALADLNHDCLIDIGDVTVMIAYLYINGPPPVYGCP